ncbi:unnamed protein product [Prunus armeniaca]|nr:unnamed protein product [Prunus armeniaca]
MSMLHGMFKAVLQLNGMHMLLVQLPLSVVSLEERCYCAHASSPCPIVGILFEQERSGARFDVEVEDMAIECKG